MGSAIQVGRVGVLLARHRQWLFLIFLSGFLLASELCAQQSAAPAPSAAPQARAAGRVLTAGKAPVPGATVRLVNIESGRGWVSWTDENGKFELPGLPVGRYRVEVQQLGFENATSEVEVKEGAPEIEITARVASVAALAALAPKPEAMQAAPAPPPAAEKPSEGTRAAQTPAQGAAPVPPPSGVPASQTPQGQTPPQHAGVSPPATQPPPGQRPTGPGGQPRPGQQGQMPANMAEMIRQRMAQGGFQQVDPTGGANTQTEPNGSGAPIDTGPLGEASSSDAFLLSGTVGRGATANVDVTGGFGGFFGGFAQMGGFVGFSGFPGGPEGFPGMMGGANPFGGAGGMVAGGMQILMVGPGGPPMPGGPGGAAGGRAGQQGQQRQGQGQPGQGQQQTRGQQGQQQRGQQGQVGPGGFQIQGGGMEALWGMQRLLRLAANRTRFGFYNRYGSSVWNARPYALTGVPKDKVASYSEMFGVNIGGPLVIPKIYSGRDKTFYFVNYDFSRNRNPVDTFATVPTLEERNGDFTARGAQLFDPASNLNGPRTSFGSVIPAGRIDSAAAGLLQFVPLPNLPGFAQNYHLQTRVPQDTDRLNVRILHTINQRLNLQVIYGMSSSRSRSISSFLTLQGKQSTLGQNASIGLTQQWSPRLTHDTRINWSRNSTDSTNLYAFTQDIAGNLGITGISTDPMNFGVPSINYTNFTDLNDPVPAIRHNQTFRFMDTFTFTRGRHTVRTGLEIRRQSVNSLNDPIARGQYTFTGLMTSQLDAQGRPLQGTGNDFADFLLGLPQSTNVRFGSSRTYFRNWGYNWYAQEDWRIHPRFSISLGIRYEAMTPPIELFDKIANLLMNDTITAVAVAVPYSTNSFGQRIPRSLINGDYNNWAPRFGFAWRPKTPNNRWPRNFVVRGGYSIFFNGSVYTQLAAGLANQPPHASAQTLLTSSAQVLTLQNGFPAVTPGDVPNTIAVDPNYKVGYAQMWNLTVEQEVMRNITVDLTYTGTKGTHLDLLRSPNRAVPSSDPLVTELQRRIPNAPGFTYDTFGASSIYHAFQLGIRRRMTRGFMLAGNYTYGKSIDNASSIGGGGQVVVQDDNNFAAERGLSSFDVRHRITSFFNWELPFGERKRWFSKGRAASIFGNFSLNGNVTWQTGTPFTARLLGNAANNSGTGNSFSERPDQVGDPNLPRSERTSQHWFDTTAFAQPPASEFGNAARNTIEGPGNMIVNLSLGKNIRLGKDGQRRLDLRWETNNLFNHPNFTGLNTVLGSSNFGRVQGTRQMRTMNLNIRFNF
jgi:hypothetical protein